MNGLDWDKKYYDARTKRVKNKLARVNLCFSKKSQEPDYQNKKGRIIAYKNVPNFLKIMTDLPKFMGKKAKNLKAEGNKYYDLSKTGIGYHGDTERRIVIAFRLGSSMPLALSMVFTIKTNW